MARAALEERSIEHAPLRIGERLPLLERCGRDPRRKRQIERSRVAR